MTVRRGEGRAVEGSTVIRAVVHARLLGLRLLTLDARVVVAPAAAEPGVAAYEEPARSAPAAAPRIGRAPARPRQPAALGSGSRSDVGTARLLLAEGAEVLAQARPPQRPRAVS